MMSTVVANDWLTTDSDERLEQRLAELDAAPYCPDVLDRTNRTIIRAAILCEQARRMLHRWKDRG